MASYRQRPARFDIECVAGEDISNLDISVTVDGEDYPFSGATLAAYVFDHYDMESKTKNPTPLATLTVSSPEDGRVRLSVSDTITGTTLGPGEYDWACDSTSVGVTRTVLAGSFTVTTHRP